MSITPSDRDLPMDRTADSLRADQLHGNEQLHADHLHGTEQLRGTEERLTLSEEELAIGKREVRAGEVEIEKRVETEHVRREVPLTHDEVTVERRPLEGGMVAAGGLNHTIGEEHIRVPLTAEEAVVEKRVVPKEELVVRKQEVTEERMVEADLRTERAEVREVNAHEVRHDEVRHDRDSLGGGNL
jgi:uncharacterized protein (TIGR02271 family)